MMPSCRVLLEGLSFGEAPRWRGGRLWFSDFYRRAVYTVGLDGTATKVVEVPHQPSGLGWLPDGGLLVVSMTDRRVLRLAPNGQLEEHADLSDIATFHANDMLVDDSGGAWVGNFGYDLHADLRARELPVILDDDSAGQAMLARIGRDGTVGVAARDLRFPNGMALVDGGRVLVVAETLRLQLTAFNIADDGTLGARRVYARLAELLVAPDGICPDPEGGVWVANALGPQVLRVADGGQIMETVTTSQFASACALGGEDGRTLFAMTAPSSEPGEVEGKFLSKIEIATV